MDQTIAPLAARRSGPLKGRVRVPGDKSISHRSLILGALTVGRNPDHRPARGRGRHQHRQGDARARRDGRAHRGGRLAGQRGRGRGLRRSRPLRSISAIPAPAAAWSWGRSRVARSPRPSTAMPRCARGRCGACSTRSSAWARAPRASPRAGGCRSRSPARATRSRSSTSRRSPPRSSSPRCCSPASRRRARRW